jgi:hypothetical protein
MGSMCDGTDRYKPPSLCAAGSCMMQAKIPCMPYACDTAAPSGCKTSCTTNTDCAKPSKCTVTAGVGTCG